MSEEKVYSRSPESEIPPSITPFLNNITKITKTKSSITLDKALGKGGYGTVYSCYDETNKQLAVKCINTKDFGIPSLMEASIMSIIKHPNIAQAVRIYSTPQKLYIIQDIAISDIQVYRLNNELSKELIIKWIHMISQGLLCLHKNNIIHGDIKSNNILIYPDQTLKISDFTLSTDQNWTNKYKVCTATHRPIEVWLEDEWDSSVDIWALGCTVFEIVYGHNLFIPQSKDASINALIDWNNYLPTPYRKKLNIKRREEFHYSYNLPGTFNPSNIFDGLIISLLTVSAKDRMTIHDILKLDMFIGYEVAPIIKYKSKIDNKLPDVKLDLKSNHKNKTIKTLKNIVQNEEVINIALDLYSRINGLLNISDNIKIATCAWIGNKLVERKKLPLLIIPYDLHDILRAEREICEHLSYRLF
jgi:serine/threonine protein kinase